MIGLFCELLFPSRAQARWDAKMQAAYETGFSMQIIETHLKRQRDQRALTEKGDGVAGVAIYPVPQFGKGMIRTGFVWWAVRGPEQKGPFRTEDQARSAFDDTTPCVKP